MAAKNLPKIANLSAHRVYRWKEFCAILFDETFVWFASYFNGMVRKHCKADYE